MFKISSAALTAVDLLYHQSKIGGLNRTLSVLEELIEEVELSDVRDLLSSDAEIIKAKIRDTGNHKIIAKVNVSLNDRANIYEAEFVNLGLKKCPFRIKW